MATSAGGGDLRDHRLHGTGRFHRKIAYKPLETPAAGGTDYRDRRPLFVKRRAADLRFRIERNFPDILHLPDWHVASVVTTVTGEAILTTIAATIVIMIALTTFINHTRIGAAMQAVSERPRGAAQLMGVNVNSTISVTFAIGSALAAVASLLLCSSYPLIAPYTGAMPGIKVPRSGRRHRFDSGRDARRHPAWRDRETSAKAYISSTLSDAIVFGVLIIVLLVKPTGILGKDNARESVGDRCENKLQSKSLNKTTRQNMITYAIVAACFVFCAVYNGMLGRLQPDQRAVCTDLRLCHHGGFSLNLTVGILGELSLGHAGFMCLGLRRQYLQHSDPGKPDFGLHSFPAGDSHRRAGCRRGEAF